jgi:hypothetical protein
MAGFTFRYRVSGGAPTVQSLVIASASALAAGDTLNLTSGQVALGATTNANFAGVALETLAAAAITGGTTKIRTITDADAVYGVTDANARKVGDALDLSGGTGAQGVAAPTNKEFVVVAPSTATQETLVRFNVGKHYQNKAQ